MPIIAANRREFLLGAATATAAAMLPVAGSADTGSGAAAPADFAYRSAGDLVAALAAKKISSVDGLPIGVQIIGPYLEDRATIAFAGMIEREFGGFVPPPAVR